MSLSQLELENSINESVLNILDPNLTGAELSNSIFDSSSLSGLNIDYEISSTLQQSVSNNSSFFENLYSLPENDFIKNSFENFVFGITENKLLAQQNFSLIVNKSIILETTTNFTIANKVTEYFDNLPVRSYVEKATGKIISSEVILSETTHIPYGQYLAGAGKVVVKAGIVAGFTDTIKAAYQSQTGTGDTFTPLQKYIAAGVGGTVAIFTAPVWGAGVIATAGAATLGAGAAYITDKLIGLSHDYIVESKALGKTEEETLEGFENLVETKVNEYWGLSGQEAIDAQELGHQKYSEMLEDIKGNIENLNLNESDITNQDLLQEIDDNKIVEIDSDKILVGSNGDIISSPFNPTAQKIQSFESDVSDVKANGTVISQTTETVTNSDGSVFNQTTTVIEDTDGNLYNVVSVELADGSIEPANGFIKTELVTRTSPDGTIITGTEQKTSFVRNGQEFETTEFQKEDDSNWSIRQKVTNSDGTISDDGPLFVVPSAGLLEALQFGGSTLGGLLANHLAEDSAYKQVVYGAVLKTIGSHFGTFTAFLAAGGELEAAVRAGFGETIIGQQTAVITPEFMDTLYANLSGAVSGALSNLIVGEVGDALGIEGTIVGEVFDVTAGAITAGFIQAGFGFAIKDLPTSVYTQLINSDFNLDAAYLNSKGNVVFDVNTGELVTVADQLQLQVANLIAGYAGSRLAGEVIEPENEIAGIFGSLGAAYAGTVGAAAAITGTISLSLSSSLSTIGAVSFSFAPVIGTAIGAFVGTVVGTALGNVIGGEDSQPGAWAGVRYDVDANEYIFTGSDAVAGGDAAIAAGMAQNVMDGMNNILEATHGILRHGAKAPNLQIGYDGNEFIINVSGQGGQSFGTPADAMMHAAFQMMQGFDLVGGHAVVMRAWHNSDATSLIEMKEDLEVAEAFQNYLSNPTGILALMMDQPESDLAQSWAAILQRAAALELHLPHEKDLDGGWGEILRAQGVDSALIPDLEGDTITLTDPVTGEETVLHHIIGPGYEIVRIEGTDGNDIIEVIVDGPSISYVDAGAGNDLVEGTEQADVLYGGTGDDVINGHGGNDWLHGGQGDDSLDGGAGDDLVVGGRDNDLLIGGEDSDHIYGNAGDDTLFGLSGQDFLYGGQGNDILHGDPGNPGNADWDEIYGEDGDDTLHGYGTYMDGGIGNDTYVLEDAPDYNVVRIERNAGHDVIEATTGNNVAYLQFGVSISVRELFFQQVNNDLKIRVLGENQSVTVKDYFASGSPTVFLQALQNQTQLMANIAQLVLIDSALSEQPSGDYNVLSDSVLAERSANYNFDSYWSPTGSAPWLIVQHGTAGNDGDLKGTHENSVIISGDAGNDTIGSFASSQYLDELFYGDSGDDWITSGRGTDILAGGLGDDYLHGGDQRDKLYGGHGNDEIHGGNDNDIIFGGVGDDIIFGESGDDQIHGEDGDDTITDIDGSNLIKAGSGDDVISVFGTGSNTIYGDDGNDTISAADGNNTIYGGAGIDTITGGQGADLIDGEGDNDIISGGAGDDVISGGAGIDTIHGNAGSDELHAGDDADTVYGDDGDDYIYGGSGDDYLEGNAGNDYIYGGEGNNTIYGGAGDNYLFGGSGDDLYSYSLTSGDDYIEDDGGIDSIEVSSGIVLSDLLFSRSGHDLEIINSNILTIKDHFKSDGLNAIESLIFSDASTFDLSTLDLPDNNNVPVAVNDFFSGVEDQIIQGNVFQENNGETDSDIDGDILNVIADTFTTDKNGLVYILSNGDFGYTPDVNFNGEDSFEYTLQDGKGGIDFGQVTLNVSAVNDAPSAYEDSFIGAASISLSGNVLVDNGYGADSDIDGDDISVVAETIATTQGASVVIQTNGDFTYLPVKGYVGNDSFSYTLVDSNGSSTIGTATLQLDDIYNLVTGTSASEVLNGSAGDDLIYGLEGNDTLYGNDGNDILYSHDADLTNDVSGVEHLYGGAGDDTLYAGVGEDYLYGEAGSDHLVGTEGSDSFADGWGTASDVDLIEGGAGDDSYKIITENPSGQNNLVIIDDTSGFDSLTFGYRTGAHEGFFNSSERTYSRLGNDLQLDFTNGWGDATVLIKDQFTNLSNTNGAGIEQMLVITSPGVSSWMDLKSYLSTANLTINGIDSDETFYSSSYDSQIHTSVTENDVFGYSGNDLIYGGAGDDTFKYTEGYSTFHGGDGVDTVDFSEFGSAMWVDLDFVTYEMQTRDSVNLTSGSWRSIGDLTGVENIIGTGLGDKIWGDSNDNIISGGGGNDLLYGEGGNDTASYVGDYANYTVVANGSDFTVTDNVGIEGTDTLTGFEKLVFADGAYENGVFLPYSPAPVAMDDSFSGTEDQIISGNLLVDNGNGLDFDPDDDALNVTAQTIMSLLGGTVVIAANGDFTYTPAADVNGTDSFDYTLLDEFFVSDVGTVTITLSAVNDNPLASDDSVIAVEGTDLVIDVLANDVEPEGDSLTVSTVSTPGHGALILNGDNTFTYTSTAGYLGLDNFTYQISDGLGGTSEATVTISVNSPVILGTVGNDTLNGTSGNDVIDPLSGNDTLYGLDGNDHFIYRSGSDTYHGGNGVDTVDFSEFGSAMWVDLDFVTYEMQTRDSVNLTSGSWRSIGDLTGVENIIGTELGDKIWGDSNDNIISGGGGNDLLYGEGGADTFVFENSSAFSGVDTVYDFDLAEGDVLDISDLLEAYSPIDDALDQFVQITNSGSHSNVSVDVDGGADNFVQIATLNNVTGLTDEATLVANGTLIV